MATLQIELEDLAGTSWWAGVLATLASQSGNAYLRFVGVVDGHRQYTSATFPAPRTLGTLPPQEVWAPGTTKSLQDLRREIENDGWLEAGRGTEPWAFKYEHRHEPGAAGGPTGPASKGRPTLGRPRPAP